MNTSTPIILLASERSGSNLLRTLIGNHPEICAPVAPHLINEFYTMALRIRAKHLAYALLGSETSNKLANRFIGN